jgi:hypothetical protein
MASRHVFTKVIDGKQYEGSYIVDNGMIKVNYQGQTKTTQLGGSAGAPESLAGILLRELIEAASN